MGTDPVDGFLIERDPITWEHEAGFPGSLTPAGVFFQDAPNGLEVALVRVPAGSRPTAADLRRAWNKRRSGRASPVLLTAFYSDNEGHRVALCGPVGEQPVVYHDIEVSQAERLADVALSEPSHHAATRLLLATLPELDSPFPGLRNAGLLATQELKAGVPQRPDWEAAGRRARPLLKQRGRQLVEALGFQVETLATNASMLTINGQEHAVAVFCDEDEPFEVSSGRFEGTSPVSRALALADRQPRQVPWVVLTRAAEIRLYSASPDKGVGRRGRAETFVELNLSLLQRKQAGYLHLLFSAEALAPDGTLDETLENSNRFAAELAVRLRERVYNQTVPALARAVAKRLSNSQAVNTIAGQSGHDLVDSDVNAYDLTESGITDNDFGDSDLSVFNLTESSMTDNDSAKNDLSEDDLADAYEQVMMILFRLLLVAYAEDKDLLPYRTNSNYFDCSLSLMARELTDALRNGSAHYSEHSTGLWDAATRLWDAVNEGSPTLGVPPYNGGLFTSDPALSKSGAAIADLTLSDAEFGPALEGVLVDNGPEGLGPVDFRSLTVREFGTIYEGLLESRLSVAQDDLVIKTIKGEDQYVPAGDETEVDVLAGAVYFHNYSGARKATGSYFTKPFAVTHLLDHALEPALDDHIARLDSYRNQGDDAAVADAFFDFRCADIAMGSGHFLVAAVDRIEARLSAWLALNPVPAVSAELTRLRKAAQAALGDLSDAGGIEDCSLLRRQVARHCIYGIDKNRIAVELARLSIWIHTFVPGLPLSFLDHNLVHGDCLTGVVSSTDAVEALTPKKQKAKNGQPGTQSIFMHQLDELLHGCDEDLAKLGRLNDADKSEIEAARKAHAAARDAVAPAEAVFDVVTAVRAEAIGLNQIIDFTPESVAKLAERSEVRTAIERFTPIHYPSTWPEVFARTERGGFDCLLGNPPWEKVVVDRKVWWGMYLPGIRSLPVSRKHAKITALEARRPDLAAVFLEEKERAESLKELLRATFPKLGSGQTDLYKVFSWANLALCRLEGHIGIVLPRTAVADAGMATWRTEVVGASNTPPPPRGETARNTTARGHGHQPQGLGIRGGTPFLHSGVGGPHPILSVATGLNTKQWAFDGVDGRYTVALVAIVKINPRSEPWRCL